MRSIRGKSILLAISFIAFLSSIADTTSFQAALQEARRQIDASFRDEAMNRIARDTVQKIADSKKSEEEKASELEKYIESIRGEKEKDKGKSRPDTLKTDRQAGKTSSLSATVPQNEKKDTSSVFKSLVLISGKEKSGSGFAAVFNGGKAIITNISLLFDNSNLKILDFKSKPVEIKSIYFAEDRDIALINVSPECDIPPLAMEKDIANVPLKSNITIYGTSPESSQTFQGILMAFTVKTLDLSCGTGKDNSGGPVISDRTSRAIGVSCHAVRKTHWSDTEPSKEKILKFAARIDNLDPEKLIRLDISAYNNDIQTQRALREANELGEIFLKDVYGEFKNSRETKVIMDYLENEQRKDQPKDKEDKGSRVKIYDNYGCSYCRERGIPWNLCPYCKDNSPVLTISRKNKDKDKDKDSGQNSDKITWSNSLDPGRYVKYKFMDHMVRQWNTLSAGNDNYSTYSSLLGRIKNNISKPAIDLRRKPSKYKYVNEENQALLDYNDFLISEINALEKRMSEVMRLLNSKKKKVLPPE